MKQDSIFIEKIMLNINDTIIRNEDTWCKHYDCKRLSRRKGSYCKLHSINLKTICNFNNCKNLTDNILCSEHIHLLTRQNYSTLYCNYNSCRTLVNKKTIFCNVHKDVLDQKTITSIKSKGIYNFRLIPNNNAFQLSIVSAFKPFNMQKNKKRSHTSAFTKFCKK